ncbi:hypothetical protein ACWCQL_13385, partial [Streptomyces sp. NPDC002073]
KAATIQAYVADTLADRESVVMTATNARATEVSREIRSELVRYGLVEETGLPLLDDNRAGVGDLIQTRENDTKLRDSEGRMVLNRRVYRVTGIGEDGQLTAARVAGRDSNGTERLAGTITLPADYVQENVALAYAGTVNAVQGRTVGYGGYLLVEEGMSRQQVYPGLTRAQRYNRAFAACQVPGDEHRLQNLDQDAFTLIQSAVERDGGELSALQELRESQDWAESIPALEPRWNDYVTEHTRNQYEPMLRQMLSEDHYTKLMQGDPSTVYRKLREAELAGHDGKRLLAGAIGMRPMSYPVPDNVPALVNWRIDMVLEDRTPEYEPAGPNWSDRTPQIPGIEGEVARELAEAMDVRRDVLGERLTEEPPEWAVRHLGPLPEDVLDRAEWARRAGTVEGYRELYGIDAPNTAIGRLPARGAVEQRAAWEAAHSALGRTEDQETLARTSDTALREMVNRYEREKSWAPTYMGEELSEARQMVLRYEEKAILAQADADQCADAAERAELEAQARGYEDLVANLSARVETMEQIDEARSAWWEETAPAREAAEAARDELDRRGADDRAQAEQDADEVLDEELAAEPEYDVDQAEEIDWTVEGETLDQAPEQDVEAELPLAQEEQEELDQALAAYEQQHRADVSHDVDQAEEIDWTVEGETLDQALAVAVDQGDVEPQLDEQNEQRVKDEQAPQAEEAAEVTTTTEVPTFRPGPELDAALAAYEQQLREQAAASREAEPEYDLDQAPEISWETEGETVAERPEQNIQAEVDEDVEVELQPEAAQQTQAQEPAVSAPTAEDEYRAIYEQQYAQQIGEGAGRSTEAAAQASQAGPKQEKQREARHLTASGQRLPAQLADLQADLDRAHGALAEIAARQAERDRSAQADDAVRAEQAEVSRTREAEVEVSPQIQQDQGPIISY